MANLLVSDAPGDDDWSLAERFHGHIGPWLALGMRIGAIAVADLGLRPHFGVQADVACPLYTPFSCILDGLQLSTGATLGKRNISAKDSSQTSISVTITNKDSGRSMTFTVSPDAGDLLAAWFQEQGGEGAARRIWTEPSSRLFVIEQSA